MGVTPPFLGLACSMRLQNVSIVAATHRPPDRAFGRIEGHLETNGGMIEPGECRRRRDHPQCVPDKVFDHLAGQPIIAWNVAGFEHFPRR